ncbi:MAG TPA: hypothetical protein VHW23_46455 [Kofleriaceae bacterium]|nr:hypothetical protein [Kofleriaceae bacterium]
MTPEQRGQLEEIVSEVNLAKIFKDLDDLGRRIEAFAVHYAQKLKVANKGAIPAPLASLERVLAEYRSNPYRVEALLQAMAFGCTAEMLAMIWMSELGCTIQNLTLEYVRHDRVLLQIELRLLDASTLQFHSTEIWDLAVLRLVGLAKSNEAPDMSGFYPMRTGAIARD